MAKERKPSTKPIKPKRIPVDPNKEAKEVPVVYLRFLDAALTESVFRQTLHDAYKATDGDDQWNAMVDQLIKYRVLKKVPSADEKSAIMSKIVAVDWSKIYAMEEGLQRKADAIGDKLGKFDA